MCGIVGAIMDEDVVPLLLKGLSRLEYRGYDSAGIAVSNNDGEIMTLKSKGKLVNLNKRVNEKKLFFGYCGIGHTRWATHGEPSETNAHPHFSDGCNVVGVHNGIIENYLELKERLVKNGYLFYSTTDTEVAVKLIDYCYKRCGRNPVFAIRDSMLSIRGSYALEIMFKDYPNKIFLARKDSPLIVGINHESSYVASDVPALIEYTDKVYCMSNMEIGEISRGKAIFYNIDGDEIKKAPVKISWSVEETELNGYDCFMEKEIHEQPITVQRTINAYIKNGKIDFSACGITEEILKGIKSIKIIGCGSAYHVGVIGQSIIEKYAKIPVRVDYASEFRYREHIPVDNELVIVISQSGETADTLFAMRDARSNGARILAVVNVVGSSIAREADNVIYTLAGPEIAVATTKAYTAQISVLCLLALEMSRINGHMSSERYDSVLNDALELSHTIEKILWDKKKIKEIAQQFKNIKDAYFIGRGIDYAICLEGSLKMKEISYVHSEAYAAGELKHGTISLIENGTLVIGVITQKNISSKTLSNLSEVKSRGAYVVTVTALDPQSVKEQSDSVFCIPKVHEMLAPILAAVPLQLLGYYMSTSRGLDVDKPRNLAKSVTVE